MPMLVLAFALLLPAVAWAQEPPATGFEAAGLPAINFDADEGFGYGVIAELYQYGNGAADPYVWSLQPKVFLTTGGRRDFTVFFDAPRLLPEGWRVDAFVGSERQVATPYYGLGNATPYDEALEDEDGPDPHYYDYGRLRRSGRFNLQRAIPTTPIRFLFGAGLVSTEVEPIPDGEGTTLYAADHGAIASTYWSNFVSTGLVWDTRDRETGPRRGTWTELVVQRVERSLGADFAATRLTFVDRRYFPLSETLVLAHRVVLQGIDGDPPAPEQSLITSSFKQAEGLGGSSSVRGLPKNRYSGRGMFVWNTELRWEAARLALVGRSLRVVLSGFADQGRVWRGGVRWSEVLSDLHRGYGGGVRGVLGENFTAALDLGTSEEAGLKIYIGLGYLF